MSNILTSPSLQTYAALPEDILHISVPLAVANDFDSTLGITGKLPTAERPQIEGAMGLLLKVASEDYFLGSSEPVIDAWREAEESGGSFDSLSHVELQLPEDKRAAFRARYMANIFQVPLLYADTEQYLSDLNRHPGVPNFTLTYGNRPWQELKTETSKLPGHVEITDQKEKGPVLESMRSEDGTYTLVAAAADNKPLAVVHAGTIVLVDDKPKSFAGLPDNASGMLIDRGEGRKKSQMGEVDPARVRTVHSLGDISIPHTMRPNYDLYTAMVMRAVTRFVPVNSFVAASKLLK